MNKRKLAILLPSAILAIVLIGCGSDEASQEDKCTVTITLNYEEVFLTTNTTMNVCVDDSKIGRQEAGTTVSYDVSLEKGNHTFYLKNDGIYKTDQLSFEVFEDGQTFAFGTKTRLTFGMEVWNE